jgi:hypothetical protein
LKHSQGVYLNCPRLPKHKYTATVRCKCSLRIQLTFLLLVALSVCSTPPIVHARVSTDTQPDKETISSASGLDGLLALKIYRVNNGKMNARTFSRDALRQSGSISIPGYVSGIVVVGEQGLSVRVAGKPMSPVKPDAAGEFSLGYYGSIDPSQMIRPSDDRILSNQYASDSKPEVYSYFPLVPADTIHGESEFIIEISSGQSSPHQLKLSHKGLIERHVPSSRNTYQYRYTGFTGDPAEEIKDLEDRCQAIAAGIAAVESYAGVDLINTVNIINYDDIHNAVTYLNHNDIWFYINTLKNEPIDELTVIAQHEALHILVDKLNLTSNSHIRKLYADLKGFDPSSMERLQVVSQGTTPRNARLDKGRQGVFFEFISERNFFNGMKGGHPQENLDEFCTSFLHTVMHPELLQGNLMAQGGSLKIQDAETREMILSTYIQMLNEVRETWIAGPGTGRMDAQLAMLEKMNHFMTEIAGR